MIPDTDVVCCDILYRHTVVQAAAATGEQNAVVVGNDAKLTKLCATTSRRRFL